MQALIPMLRKGGLAWLGALRGAIDGMVPFRATDNCHSAIALCTAANGYHRGCFWHYPQPMRGPAGRHSQNSEYWAHASLPHVGRDRRPHGKGPEATCGPRWQAEWAHCISCIRTKMVRCHAWKPLADVVGQSVLLLIQTQLLPSLVEPLKCFVLADWCEKPITCQFAVVRLPWAARPPLLPAHNPPSLAQPPWQHTMGSALSDAINQGPWLRVAMHGLLAELEGKAVGTRHK